MVNIKEAFMAKHRGNINESVDETASVNKLGGIGYTVKKSKGGL